MYIRCIIPTIPPSPPAPPETPHPTQPEPLPAGPGYPTPEPTGQYR